MHRSLAEHKLLEGIYSEVVNLDKEVQSQWLFCRQAAIASQCKLMNRDVTCIHFGLLKTNLAATFWINCRVLTELPGRPAKRALQQVQPGENKSI